MKRITAIAAAFLFAACLAINLATAQKGGKTIQEKKQIGKKYEVELVPSPTPTPPNNPYDASMHTGWDSGLLQKEIGSKNKDKKKLVMKVWYEYGHDSQTTYWWQVKYSLKAENKDLMGPGWHGVGDLYAMYYHMVYKLGNGQPITKTASIPLNGQTEVQWNIIDSGSHSPYLPNFSSNNFTGKRGGGSSGIDLAWP
jgi:hypothetical protein